MVPNNRDAKFYEYLQDVLSQSASCLLQYHAKYNCMICFGNRDDSVNYNSYNSISIYNGYNSY